MPVRIDNLFFLILRFDIFGEIIGSSTISGRETSYVLVSSHCELTGPVSFWSFLCNYEAFETIIKKRKNGEPTKGRGNAEVRDCPTWSVRLYLAGLKIIKLRKKLGYISFADCVIVI